VSVTFQAGSKLVRIEQEAFSGCSSLKRLCLPSSLEYVGANCFEGCRSMSTLEFAMPSHLRELMDLPQRWRRLGEIPDSVEILGLARWDMDLGWRDHMDLAPVFGISIPRQRTGRYALNFGRESMLKQVITGTRRSFLRLSSRNLKLFRSDLEFGQDFRSLCGRPALVFRSLRDFFSRPSCNSGTDEAGDLEIGK
jgi:hypothetical protein